MVTQNMLRTCEGKQVFFENNFQICYYSQSKHMPYTNLISDITPKRCASTTKLLSNIPKYQGWGRDFCPV